MFILSKDLADFKRVFIEAIDIISNEFSKIIDEIQKNLIHLIKIIMLK